MTMMTGVQKTLPGKVSQKVDGHNISVVILEQRGTVKWQTGELWSLRKELRKEVVLNVWRMRIPMCLQFCGGWENHKEDMKSEVQAQCPGIQMSQEGAQTLMRNAMKTFHKAIMKKVKLFG